MRLFGFFLTTTIAFLPLHEGLARSENGNVKLTAYSAACRHDSSGGRNGSPSGLKPRSYTVDGKSKVVMAAVPQRGGTNSLEGCFFRIKLASSKTKVPSKLKRKIESLRKQIEGKIFFAGDKYGRGSNHQKKIDLSYECGSGLGNYTFYGSKIERLNCPGLRARKKIEQAIERMNRTPAFEDGNPATPKRGLSMKIEGTDFSDPLG